MRAKWTDLAVEACGSASKSDTERLACGMERLTVRIDSEHDAQAMGRPCGVYVTLTCPQTMSIALKTRQALAHELARQSAFWSRGTWRGAYRRTWRRAWRASARRRPGF